MTDIQKAYAAIAILGIWGVLAALLNQVVRRHVCKDRWERKVYAR